MLRSTVVSGDSSVYGACWSPDSQTIAYTQGKCVVVKQLAPNTKPLRVSHHLATCVSRRVCERVAEHGSVSLALRADNTQTLPGTVKYVFVMALSIRKEIRSRRTSICTYSRVASVLIPLLSSTKLLSHFMFS